MKKLVYLTSIWLFICFIACNQVRKAEIKNADGILVETFEFIEDSIRHGLQLKFDDNKVREEATYEKGKLNGSRKIFFPSGNVEIEEIYENDVIHGPYYVYYENGNKSMDVVYTQGKMQGILKRYYETGELLEEVTMVNNQENGPFKEFYKNGQVQWEGTYKNGDKEFGLLKQFDEKGELIKKMMCNEMAVCQTIWTKEKGDIVPDKIILTAEEEEIQ